DPQGPAGDLGVVAGGEQRPVSRRRQRLAPAAMGGPLVVPLPPLVVLIGEPLGKELEKPPPRRGRRPAGSGPQDGVRYGHGDGVPAPRWTNRPCCPVEAVGQAARWLSRMAARVRQPAA